MQALHEPLLRGRDRALAHHVFQDGVLELPVGLFGALEVLEVWTRLGLVNDRVGSLERHADMRLPTPREQLHGAKRHHVLLPQRQTALDVRQRLAQ